MELLNVGCGSQTFEYAINIDVIEDKSLNIIEGDANELDELYDSNSVDVIYMLCPYRYYPFLSKAHEILKPTGLLVITGTYSNTYFKEVWLSSETFINQMGFDTVSKAQNCHPEFFNSRTSRGKKIEVSTIKQVILRKR